MKRTEKTAAFVAGMVELGMSRAMIARALETSVTTLRRAYGDVLKPQKRGRKPVVEEFPPQVAEMVRALAGLGMKVEPLSQLMGISKTSLLRNFRDEIDTAQERLDVNVINALYKNATTNMVPAAQIFWLKARRGWRDRTVVEHKGNVGHGQPVELDLDHLYERMTPEEREAWKLVLAALERLEAEDAVTNDAGDEAPPTQLH